MRRLLIFREEALVVPDAPGLPDPVVAFDPETFEAELLLDRTIQSIEPEGPLDISSPLDPPRTPPSGTGPFRAVVLPQRLHGLEVRPTLRPGARVPELQGLVPPPKRPEFALTAAPLKVTAVGAQALDHAQDILDADELVLELRVLALSSTGGTPSITVELQTGMQVESTKGWVSAGVFPRVTSAPSSQLRRFRGLLRYVRWNVTAMGGTAPTATFALSGLARRWSLEASPTEIQLS